MAVARSETNKGTTNQAMLRIDRALTVIRAHGWTDIRRHQVNRCHYKGIAAWAVLRQKRRGSNVHFWARAQSVHEEYESGAHIGPERSHKKARWRSRSISWHYELAQVSASRCERRSEIAECTATESQPFVWEHRNALGQNWEQTWWVDIWDEFLQNVVHHRSRDFPYHGGTFELI